MKKKTLFWTLFSIALCLLLSPAYSEPDAYSVLILHSYNIDFQWTADQHNAFIETLKKEDFKITLSIEFMDTKKYPAFVDDQLFIESLRKKYGNRHYDLIYATDNDALNFLNDHKEDFFPDTPIIVSGINYGTDISGLSEDMYVVLEEVDFIRTIDLMRLTHQSLDTIHIVNDLSTTGKIFKEHLINSVIPLYPDITFKWVEDIPLQDFPEYFQKIGFNEGVMLTIYFTDGKSETYTEKEVASVLAENVKTPIWCNWDFHLNSGVVGGALVSGTNQGRKAGEIAIELLLDQMAPNITYDTSASSRITLDYTVLKSYEIEKLDYPEETIFLNKPISYFEKNRILLIIFSGVVSLLLLIITGLVRLNKAQHLVQVNSNELLAMKTAIINDQTEIVFRIGEMIETRSHDTGNHVRRVALISKALGRLQNLSKEALRDLETAAAIHDVGKIGIPEEIINKPGKLTLEEFEIMKTHTTLGHKVFSQSDLPIFSSAAIIAHQHHEYWNGAGYPLGISGEEINLCARIVAVADVFDALLSKRSYKEPWTIEDTLGFIEEQKGKMFDPKIVEDLNSILQELLSIRQQYQD